jgi:hypothetical protein
MLIRFWYNSVKELCNTGTPTCSASRVPGLVVTTLEEPTHLLTGAETQKYLCAARQAILNYYVEISQMLTRASPVASFFLYAYLVLWSDPHIYMV